MIYGTWLEWLNPIHLLPPCQPYYGGIGKGPGGSRVRSDPCTHRIRSTYGPEPLRFYLSCHGRELVQRQWHHLHSLYICWQTFRWHYSCYRHIGPLFPFPVFSRVSSLRTQLEFHLTIQLNTRPNFMGFGTRTTRTLLFKLTYLIHSRRRNRDFY